MDELRPNDPIPESDSFQFVLTSLEFYIPAVLREVYSDWRDESLDGFALASARKTADREIELLGLCNLISDNSWTPFKLMMQLDEFEEDVAWLECRLGEKTGAGRMQISCEGSWSKRLWTLEDRLDEIEWSYKVGFGKRS